MFVFDLVHVYQEHGRPLTSKSIRCRYRPTCSGYSVQAFQKFGFLRGFYLARGVSVPAGRGFRWAPMIRFRD